MKIIAPLLEVPLTDPDDQRRSRLLVILLLGVAALTTLALLATAAIDIAGKVEEINPTELYLGSLGMLTGIGIILAINRFWSGQLAGVLFLLILTISLAFTDHPQEVVNGRSLFTFAIPILMASVLLRPSASFIWAGLVSLLIGAIALTAQIVPNAFAMLSFFALALVSWLSARSLEQALTDLRTINRELDLRVEERTRDLAAALAREQTEASKNQAILEGIADGVIVFDNKGEAIVANPAMVDLIERPGDEIAGRDIMTLMNEDVALADRETIADLLKDREAHTPSLKFEWGTKTLSVSVAPVRASPDQVTGTVAVFRDYTREAEVERMKSAFVSMVSHDLRTPLSVIIGYVDVLREAVYGPLTEKQLGVLSRITANARRLLSLVNNLLDQAQIEAGRLALNITSFAPSDLLEDLESVIGLLSQTKGLEMTWQVSEDVPDLVSGDRQRLNQILVNLVSNAIKFTEEGSVDVRVYRIDKAYWALEVSDTGPGIPLEAQSHIFDAFWQLDSSVTRQHSGVGLGLAITKQLITQMDGEIMLASEVGRGSTFTVVLPLILAQEVES